MPPIVATRAALHEVFRVKFKTRHDNTTRVKTAEVKAKRTVNLQFDNSIDPRIAARRYQRKKNLAQARLKAYIDQMPADAAIPPTVEALLSTHMMSSGESETESGTSLYRVRSNMCYRTQAATQFIRALGVDTSRKTTRVMAADNEWIDPHITSGAAAGLLKQPALHWAINRDQLICLVKHSPDWELPREMGADEVVHFPVPEVRRTNRLAAVTRAHCSMLSHLSHLL